MDGLKESVGHWLPGSFIEVFLCHRLIEVLVSDLYGFVVLESVERIMRLSRLI